MTNHLYRFRPADKLLGQYRELENQEIYFAPPEQLNDPMEGFRDIFWKGDDVAWRSFFRHYLLCLDRALTLMVLAQESQTLEWNSILIFNTDQVDFSTHHKLLHDDIFNGFFKESAIQSLIHQLSTRSNSVRRDELYIYLRNIHPFALFIISDCYIRHKLLPEQSMKPDIQKNAVSSVAKLVGLVSNLEKENQDHKVIDHLFSVNRSLSDQVDLINQFNGRKDLGKSNKNFVFLEFVDGYIRNLEKLVFPNWYTACFMTDCRNSSVWGHYGANHTGVCLKFKVHVNNDKSVIRLNRMVGYGTSGPIWGGIDHQFYPIVYSKNLISVDFFRSLGRLSMHSLQNFWYSDVQGNRSVCADDLFLSKEKWVNAYWEKFFSSVTTKLEDWQYERECRLILTDSILDFSDSKSRKVKYNFSDLEGIIFGIKTSISDKVEIMKIIEDKCHKENRTDFKFYQAYYNRESGTIEHAEMGLVKSKKTNSN